MIYKQIYDSPLAEVLQAMEDSVLCDSAGVTSENFDSSSDYEW